jgi:hypothetical protein
MLEHFPILMFLINHWGYDNFDKSSTPQNPLTKNVQIYEKD